jgi:hypothetical protein
MENLIFRNANVSTAKFFCSNFMRTIHMSSTLQFYSILIFALTSMSVMSGALFKINNTCITFFFHKIFDIIVLFMLCNVQYVQYFTSFYSEANDFV